jgi:hypothetical protein
MRPLVFEPLVRLRRPFVVGLLCALLFAVAGCGGATSVEPDPTPDPAPTPTPEPSHRVPAWFSANEWRLMNIPDMGVYLGDRDTGFVVSETTLTYDYPDCSVTATLKMDPSLSSVAANDYTMTMVSTDCSVQWDIPTYPGMVDTGRIFAEDATNQWFYRISDLYSAYWIYKRK